MGWPAIGWLVGLGVGTLPELLRTHRSEEATVLLHNSRQGVEIAVGAMGIGQKKVTPSGKWQGCWQKASLFLSQRAEGRRRERRRGEGRGICLVKYY